METLGVTVQQAHFWRDSAGQLRELAHEPVRDGPAPEQLLKLAVEYERLADELVEDWAHTPEPKAAPFRVQGGDRSTR